MVFWSLACASHGLATGFWMLAASRFLLGAGEGGGFPAATKAVAEWFPVRERSTAMGIINAGTAVGAVVAPPAIAAIVLVRPTGAGCSSRAARPACSGRSGGCAPTSRRRSIAGSRRRTAISARLAGPAAIRGRAVVVAAEVPPGLGTGRREVPHRRRLVLLHRWLPKYLYDARGFDVKQVGYYAWVPFAAAGVGSLLGGWFSSWLLARGRSVDFRASWRSA